MTEAKWVREWDREAFDGDDIVAWYNANVSMNVEWIMKEGFFYLDDELETLIFYPPDANDGDPTHKESFREVLYQKLTDRINGYGYSNYKESTFEPLDGEDRPKLEKLRDLLREVADNIDKALDGTLDSSWKP